ncbi:MAG TPA: hypothetical protein VHL11_06000 [Phototrophicaceae bacterium]|jgi:hypothetical protein|nr:hypothetical protein [Phototrophicaceae bacterium]
MHRRRNILWGLVAVSVAAILLLKTLGILPEGLNDIATRAWAVVLVFLGLSILLRNRLPAGGIIAVVVSVALVAGIAAAAYGGRTGQPRDDYHEPIAQNVGAGVGLLQITLDILTTDVEIGLSTGSRVVEGEFIGSRQSVIQIDYDEDNAGLATMVVHETKPESFPALDSVGRGTLKINLPANVPLDVDLKITSGDSTLNLSGTTLERLNLNAQTGNALVTLPEYEPRSDSVQQNPGTLTVQNGNITLFIPEAVAARLELDRGSRGIEPQFDSTVYDYLGGVLLENRNFANSDIVIHYVVVAPRGLIRVENAP